MMTFEEYTNEHGVDEEECIFGLPFVGEIRIIDGEECEFTEEGQWIA